MGGGERGVGIISIPEQKAKRETKFAHLSYELLQYYTYMLAMPTNHSCAVHEHNICVKVNISCTRDKWGHTG